MRILRKMAKLHPYSGMEESALLALPNVSCNDCWFFGRMGLVEEDAAGTESQARSAFGDDLVSESGSRSLDLRGFFLIKSTSKRLFYACSLQALSIPPAAFHTASDRILQRQVLDRDRSR